jgi:hypothetical protein
MSLFSLTTVFYSVNLIDKEALRGDGYDEHMAWRARLFLFLVHIKR